MTVTIHRGQNQIGGSILEVRTDAARVILDIGAQLDEETPQTPPIEGLFRGRPAYDAVFITHYHSDHVGLARQLLPGIPVYMGEKAAAIYTASANYLGKPGLTPAGFLRSGETIRIRDLDVTPFLCDHSAFDAYMLLLTCGGKSVLYTGDFRANGRKSFPALLQRLPPVDVLITEGTTLSRAPAAPLRERELEKIACRALQGCVAPAFICMAATNLDRCVTAFRAARQCGRVFLQDAYTACVAAAAGGSIPNPGTFGRDRLRVFQTDGSERQHSVLEQFPQSGIKKADIPRQRYLMCVRPSMQRYLASLDALGPFAGGVLFYSMWSGYKEKADMAAFLQFMQDRGVRVVDLHTSGHADPAAILALIGDVQPRCIIPVHTGNAAWFAAHTDRTVIDDNVFSL